MATGKVAGDTGMRSIEDRIQPMVPSPPHMSTCHWSTAAPLLALAPAAWLALSHPHLSPLPEVGCKWMKNQNTKTRRAKPATR